MCSSGSLPPHRPRPAAERRRLPRHHVRLVDQQLDALAAREDLLDVLHHDVLDLVELRLRARELVGGRGGVVGVHEGGDGGGEGALEGVGGEGGRGGGGGASFLLCFLCCSIS